MSLLTISYLGFRPFLPKKHGIKGVILHTIFVVAVAVMPLVVVITVADGMIQGITNRYIETSSYHIRVYPIQSSGVIQEEYEAVKDLLVELENITYGNVETVGAGIGISEYSREGINIRGVSPGLLEDDPNLFRYLDVVEGEFDLVSPDAVVLSTSLARKLKAEVGSDFRIVTGKILNGGRILPRVSKKIVTGIVKTGYEDLDKSWVIVSTTEAGKILPAENSKMFIGLKTTDAYDDLSQTIRDIRKLLPSGWRTQTWSQLNISTYENFKTTEMVLALIMGLIVVVAGINISSSLIMLVLEKRKEIAILKSMGLSPNEVTSSFLLTGITIGVLGTIIGVILGLVISININSIIGYIEYFINIFLRFTNFLMNKKLADSFILLDTEYYLDHIPIDVNLKKLFIMTFFSIVTTSLASYFPARKAGLFKPLEILQKY